MDHKKLLACVAVGVYLLFFHGLGERDLWNSHEARAAMDAQSLLDRGDWLLPRLYDGRPELQKPPLYYWLVALAARLGGGAVDAWAVRLPAALAALGCVGCVAVLAWKRGRSREAWLAALVLATAVHFTWLARVGRIDMPLTCAVAVAVTGFALAWRRRREDPARPVFLCLLAGYLGVAAGVMLKGPIGLVLPAVVIGLLLLLEGALPAPWRLRAWASLLGDFGMWWGLPLVLLLTVPWYWLADAQTGGELTRVFLWHHNVERGLGGSRLRGHPWWFYGPQLMLDLLPWSLLLPAALWLGLRRGRWREDAEVRLGLAWLGAVLVVLSCARYKRADYLAPAYPGAALLVGCVLAQWLRASASLRRGMVVVVVVPLAWWLRVDWFLPPLEAGRDSRQFADLVRRHAPPPDPVVFFRTESHALAFHLGPPLRVLVRWEDLDALAGPQPRFVVMPPAVAGEAGRVLRRARLERLAGNDDEREHEKPLALFRLRRAVRTTSKEPTPKLRARHHARAPQAAADQVRAPEPGAPGP